jgi:hypothetical protein
MSDTDEDLIPIFHPNAAGGWYWYLSDPTLQNAHGPFKVEALARKHYYFYIRVLRKNWLKV